MVVRRKRKKRSLAVRVLLLVKNPRNPRNLVVAAIKVDTREVSKGRKTQKVPQSCLADKLCVLVLCLCQMSIVHCLRRICVIL